MFEALFMPQSSAERLGLGGIAGSTRGGGGGSGSARCLGAGSIASRSSCGSALLSNLGTTGGWTTGCRTGGGGVVPFFPTCSTLDVDFVCLSGLIPAYLRSAASLSSLVRFGGKGGSLEGSKSGARIL